MQSALDAIKIIHQLGMEMYGIGIKLHAINELLPEKSRVIWQLTELAPSLFGMLQETLLKGGSL